MKLSDIALLRLYNQNISTHKFKTPAQVVSWLGCMQGQDYPGAKWAIGLRLPSSTDTDIEHAFADRSIVRTWTLRGTLHIVAASDIMWMLDLLAPRNIQRFAGRHKQLELDDKTINKSRKIIGNALQGGGQMTRQEIYKLLEKNNISVSVQRGIHILWWNAQMGLICYGSLRGKDQAFVLLDEWIPKSNKLDKEEALAELTIRYFTSHGPATLKDFIWWSGLAPNDAKTGLELSKFLLANETVDGQIYWMSKELPDMQMSSSTIYTLPGFDEYLLGYKDRSMVLDPLHINKITPGSNGIFYPTIVIDGQVAGTWKKTIKKDTVIIEVNMFGQMKKSKKEYLQNALSQYSKYIGKSGKYII